MRNRSKVLLAAAPTLLSVAAHATSIDSFTVTPVSGGSLITFQLDASPAVTAYPSGDFEIFGVTTNVGTSNILLFSSYDFGGLEIVSAQGIPTANAYGAQLFTGANFAPTFSLGMFLLTDPFSGAVVDRVMISSIASTAVTPEPSSLFLLSTGALGLLAISRRRLLCR